MYTGPIEVWRQKSLSELENLYNEKTQTTLVGLDFIRREIEWRHQDAQQKKVEIATFQMEKLTKQMRDMTIFVIILTIVNIIVAIIPIMR